MNNGVLLSFIKRMYGIACEKTLPLTGKTDQELLCNLGLSHQNLQVSPGLRQTNSCDRCSHPCEQRSSTQYRPGDFDGTALLYNLVKLAEL